jgi:MYXO-CTERM domain-containing protein
VQEGVAWFADDGGPADDLLEVRVVVTAGPIDDTDTPDEDTDTDGSADDTDRSATDGADALSPGERVALSALGCGCAAAPSAPWLAGLGVALLAVRRRR